MKLVDILARELKEWPVAEHQILKQCSTGYVYSIEGGIPVHGITLAKDWVSANITRSEWQAAVDALKAAEAVEAAWTGEGLPPVGVVCEFAGGTPCPEDPFDKDLKEGMKVTIIAHFKCGDFTLAAFTFDPENPDRGMVQVEQANFGCFRPIRTPEQISKQARDDAIEEMWKVYWQPDVPTAKQALGLLYDAGYRKFEIVEE